MPKDDILSAQTPIVRWNCLAENHENHDLDDDDLFDIDLVAFSKRYARPLLSIALVVGIIAALAVAGFSWLQPTRWTAREGFRATFTGAEASRYPNGLRFSSADVVSTTVLDEVFDADHLSEYCDRSAFRSAVFVQEPGIDPAAAAQPSTDFELRFVKPAECKAIPQVIVFKALNDILAAWARDAETKLGVLDPPIAVVTPTVVEGASDTTQSLIVRAMALRSALETTIANAAAIEKFQGTQPAIRRGTHGATAGDIRASLNDLLSARLEPLMTMAGSNLGPDAHPWLQAMLAFTSIRARRSQATVEALRVALSAYSGGAGTPTQLATIAPLSADDSKFRQTIADRMLVASAKAGEDQADVDYYTKLLDSTGSRGVVSSEDVSHQIQEISADAKNLVTALDALYGNFARTSLGATGTMYEVTSGPSAETARAFSIRRYVFFVFGAVALTIAVGLAAALVYEYIRKRAYVQERT